MTVRYGAMVRCCDGEMVRCCTVVLCCPHAHTHALRVLRNIVNMARFSAHSTHTVVNPIAFLLLLWLCCAYEQSRSAVVVLTCLAICATRYGFMCMSACALHT